MKPWLSVVIPTIGRSTLPRLLDSLDQQDRSDDVEVLVVADTHSGLSGDLIQARDHVLEDRDDQRYVWLEHDGGTHAWGHPQRTLGMHQAQGSWIAFSQDDNLMTQTALSDMRRWLGQLRWPQPVLFRVRTWQAGLVWRTPDAVALANVDADCVVVPNNPDRFGTWELVYEGDLHFIRGTVHNWGAVAWSPAVIALGRPQPVEDWTQNGR